MGWTAELGRRGEDLAAQYLVGAGMRLLERNWRWHHKEIDIIAMDTSLHIVEVKSLMEPLTLSPLDHVDELKRRNLAFAANHYIIINNIREDTQFDIVTVIFKRNWDYTLDYIPGAFIPIFYN